jgi:hypothetical protein
MSNKIKTHSPKTGFHTFSDAKGMEDAFAESYSNIDNNYVQKSTANGIGRTFVNWDTDYSVKSNYGREDYEHFNPNEAIPKKHDEIISICMKAYDKVGIVRNVIDLMSDFGIKGIRLQHPNKRIENFYNSWFDKVKGKDRSERFLNYLYRSGTAIVNRHYAKIDVGSENEMRKSYAKDQNFKEKKVKSREIPIAYSFLHPLSVEVVDGDNAMFFGDVQLAYKVSSSINGHINSLHRNEQLNTRDQSMMNKLPKDIKDAIKNGKKIIPLNPKKVNAYHYKKDDWDNWAKPMVFSILDDLIMLEKMKLADISALDGAISSVRLWTLGKLSEKVGLSVIPTASMINKLRNILSNNVGGGVLDLVWGPELSFKESESKIWQWLGSEKYTTTLNAIYDGLGIPPTLRSSAGGGGNNSNNFIALKTLIERLEYGRMILADFWKEEIKHVQKAMGFRFPATLVFDQMVISDEAAEKQLLINMADRDIISYETLRETFGINDSIESIRIRREALARGEKNPEKASPFHNPMFNEDLKKIALQGGAVTPSEVGLELEEGKDGEENRNDQMGRINKDIQASKPVATGKPATGIPGRPKNITETKKRKPRPDIKPKSTGSLVIWAKDAQNSIAEMLTPIILKTYGKKNVRSLTKEQAKEFEEIKFGTLMQMEPFVNITDKMVYNALSVKNIKNQEAIDIVNSCEYILNNISDVKKEITITEIRELQSIAYAEIKGE